MTLSVAEALTPNKPNQMFYRMPDTRMKYLPKQA